MSSPSLNQQKTIGILGGGQLARMLVLSAHKWGLPHRVLTSSREDPAAQVTPQITIGDPTVLVDIKKFISTVDILTFESDFHDSNILEYLTSLAPSLSSALVIRPAASLLTQLTQRHHCKQLLVDAGFTVAPYAVIPQQIRDYHQWHTWRQQSHPELGQKLFIKLVTGGYDGRGTHFINCESDDHELGQTKKHHKSNRHTISASQQCHEFLKTHASSEMIVEANIPFIRELAITVVRSACGEFYFFPLVETKQSHYQCDSVSGPVMTVDITRSNDHGLSQDMGGQVTMYQVNSDQKESHLRENFVILLQNVTRFLNSYQYVGAITFELFEQSDGTLMVNEVSPRVHNSCHYSMDAMSSSQFDLHLKAILGWDLGVPKLKTKGFAMVNIIGHQKNSQILFRETTGSYLHLYGKTHREHRKMGHINVLSSSREKALKKALRVRGT